MSELFFWIWGTCITLNIIMVYLCLKYDTKYEFEKRITLGEFCGGISLGIFLAPVMTILIPYLYIKEHKDDVIFKWGQEDKKE